MTTNHTAEKQRSYTRRVRPGAQVRLARQVVQGRGLNERVAPKGALVTVTCESNAGFRGIELSFRYEGESFHGVSTGVIV